jgi:hypothetical protein
LPTELRDALTWAADNAEYRTDAHRLAITLADLSFARGMPGESQRRYEQAAELAADDKAAAAPSFTLRAPPSRDMSAPRR